MPALPIRLLHQIILFNHLLRLGTDIVIKINWEKKNFTILKWLGAGPAFLLYLIFLQDMNVFENSIAEGIFLSAVIIIMPSVAVFLIYWPIAQTRESDSEEEANG